ncbi:MAG TPA: hypothetical protein VHX44_07045 [Planctomycetota bacterium]|nr:hypothetical protein [Planctomycetota bacterium]
MIRSLLLSAFASVATLVTSTGGTAADLQALDPVAFAKVITGDATVRKLASGMKFLEGPAWTAADGGWLVFSDIPSNELKKWSAGSGLTTYRMPSNNANGNVFDV